MSVRDAASGIIEIATHHMSDLIRKMTIERGYDPREFVVYGFGGAGPLHGGAFGRELGVKEVIFPLGNIASAFSALGLAVSDLITVTQLSDLALAPFDAIRFGEHFEALEKEAVENLAAGGAKRSNIVLQRVVELRYKGQVHQVDTPVPLRQGYASDPRRRDRGVRTALREALRPRLRFPPGGHRACDLPSGRFDPRAGCLHPEEAGRERRRHACSHRP